MKKIYFFKYSSAFLFLLASIQAWSAGQWFGNGKVIQITDNRYKSGCYHIKLDVNGQHTWFAVNPNHRAIAEIEILAEVAWNKGKNAQVYTTGGTSCNGDHELDTFYLER